jgi:hypothetical protein
MEEIRKFIKFWDDSKDLGPDRRIKLEWILRVIILGKQSGLCRPVSCGSGPRPMEGFCKHGNEPSVSMKGREFLDQLSDSFSRKTLPWS